MTLPSGVREHKSPSPVVLMARDALPCNHNTDMQSLCQVVRQPLLICRTNKYFVFAFTPGRPGGPTRCPFGPHLALLQGRQSPALDLTVPIFGWTSSKVRVKASARSQGPYDVPGSDWGCSH